MFELYKPFRNRLGQYWVIQGLEVVYPPSFCSLQTLDQAIYVCGKREVEEVFQRKVQGENQQWALDTYLGSFFAEVLATRAKMSLSSEWTRIDAKRH